jgi:hypothetical protein
MNRMRLGFKFRWTILSPTRRVATYVLQPYRVHPAAVELAGLFGYLHTEFVDYGAVDSFGFDRGVRGLWC